MEKKETFSEKLLQRTFRSDKLSENAFCGKG